MKLVFKTAPELSFFQAMRVVATQTRVVDPKLEATLREAAQVINERLELAEVEVSPFWETLLGCPSQSDGDRVEQSLLAAGCPELGIDSLAPGILGRLADARLAMRETFPKLADQLPLRARPLRELWEAGGPGILREMGRLTTAKLVPTRATLQLVQPARGGDGGLLADGDAVWMEAVLTNPDPAIPETLRLAWLIARLGWRKMQQAARGQQVAEGERGQIDRGQIDRGQMERGQAGGEAVGTGGAVRSAGEPELAAAMALIPYAIKAGGELGLVAAGDAQAEARTIELAAGLWVPSGDADAVLKWWEQMQQQSLPLPVAIRALDKMLH